MAQSIFSKLPETIAAIEWDDASEDALRSVDAGAQFRDNPDTGARQVLCSNGWSDATPGDFCVFYPDGYRMVAAAVFLAEYKL